MEPLISFAMPGSKREFMPGDVLVFEFQLDAVGQEEIVSVETSLLWVTAKREDAEGETEEKGTPFFDQTNAAENEYLDLRLLRKFQIVIPTLSDHIVEEALKVDWRIEIRVFLTEDREILFEQPVQVGKAS